MNHDMFKKLFLAAEACQDDYKKGYQRGLRRAYHGAAFGTADDHSKWLSLGGHRQALGDGYRDGFSCKEPDIEKFMEDSK